MKVVQSMTDPTATFLVDPYFLEKSMDNVKCRYHYGGDTTTAIVGWYQLVGFLLFPGLRPGIWYLLSYSSGCYLVTLA